MPRAALAIAYDGTRFDGFARQPDRRLRTVEGELLARLVGVGAVASPEAARFAPGSRTDRGVSARRNVVALSADAPPERLIGAIADEIPGLVPLAAVAVREDFRPRHAAWREYRYFLTTSEVGPGGPAGLAEALALFRGEHDFSAFGRVEAGRSPQRKILATDVTVEQGLVVARVRGASFIWNQVRRMMAAALGVTRGSWDARVVADGLAAPADAPDLGLAAAERLVLWDVGYPDVAFPAPGPLAEAWLQERAAEASLAARLWGSLASNAPS